MSTVLLCHVLQTRTNQSKCWSGTTSECLLFLLLTSSTAPALREESMAAVEEEGIRPHWLVSRFIILAMMSSTAPSVLSNISGILSSFSSKAEIL